jgi:hypothetical protein
MRWVGPLVSPRGNAGNTVDDDLDIFLLLHFQIPCWVPENWAKNNKILLRAPVSMSNRWLREDTYTVDRYEVFHTV